MLIFITAEYYKLHEDSRNAMQRGNLADTFAYVCDHYGHQRCFEN